MSDILRLHISNTQDISLVFTALSHLEKRCRYNFSALHQAIHELINNILEHGYHVEEGSRVDIRVTFTLKPCQLKVRVQEFGEPFDFSPYLSEPITHSSDHSKGFYHIYDLVDTFYFSSLGKGGKEFTLISQLKACTIQSPTQTSEHLLEKPPIERIKIRAFEAGDESAISQLIYQNYDYTYYKPYFYDPIAIRHENQKAHIDSFVALHEKTIIGHFALVPHVNTNCAEVAIAVVHPNYKGMGIMSRMFVMLIEHAKNVGYRSIFGEAIMLHPYSQKANLKKGMQESAIVLGLVPGDIEIEHNLKLNRRSGVLLGYLVFNTNHYTLKLPTRYKEQISTLYEHFKISFQPLAITNKKSTPIIHIDSVLNLAAIQLDSYVDATALSFEVENLLLEQTDMIYADINLHRIERIDTLIEQLNHHGFFYSGLLFDYYGNEDYLRLQKICSKSIETEHLVTYSEYGKALLDFIKEDREAIRKRL